MANIGGVSYEQMPQIAAKMREDAVSLNQEISSAYSSIANMHNDWYGVRYNDLVKAFNNLIPSLNEMLELVVVKIPFAMQTIANNYAMADRGENVVSVGNESANKIQNITISNDVGMRFMTDRVSDVQSRVSNNFRSAKNLMNNIESTFSNLPWQSDSAEVFRSTFIKLKNDIVTEFENIDTQFVKLMQQAQQDIENAERANNINV